MATALVTVAAMALAACSDDGQDTDDGQDRGGEVTRYCELVHQLEDAGEEALAELQQDPNATDEDVAASDRAFIEEHQDDFDAIGVVAPDEIRDDVATLLAARRAVAGDTAGRESDELQEAEQRVVAFDKEHCTHE